MIDRRTALVLVASVLTRQQAQAAETQTCRGHPEILTLDFGAGACVTKTVRVKQGVYTVDVPVTEILTALGAKVGP
jgi:hypothetical protein